MTIIEMTDYKDDYLCEMKRADKAEDELAALRAQLAESAWRPVTDTEPSPMEHVVISTLDGADVGWRLEEHRDCWQTRRNLYLSEEIFCWMALPDVPTKAEAKQIDGC